MKLHQLKLALCAFGFLMTTALLAMEEHEEEKKKIEKKQQISDQGQKLLGNAEPCDLEIAQALVNKVHKQIEKYYDVTLNQDELMNILGAFPEDLRELFGVLLCKKRAEDYKKLALNITPRRANYGTLCGFKYTPDLADVSRVYIGSVYTKYMPDLASAINLTYLGMTSNDITIADGSLLPVSLTELDLSRNKISVLKLQNLTNLKTLQLNKNNLKCCDGAGLPQSITQLKLKENPFTGSGALQLATLAALNRLELGKNQFTDLDNAQLPSTLQKLALCFNKQLTYLKACKLPEQLESLRLFGCKEVELRDFATHMTALKTLSLRMGTGKKRGALDCATLPPSLTELDAVMSKYADVINIACLTAIKRLDIDGNKYSVFPDCNKASQTLKHLDIGGNGVLFDETKLPATIRTLCLRGVTVPNPIFTRYIALQKLGMSNLDLTQTPNITVLSELKKLDLSSNKLAVCDGSQLPASLTALKVKSNRLLTKCLLNGQTNLKELNLAYCNVADLDKASLPVSLTDIDVFFNKVKKLELSALIHLIKLNVRRNELKNIDGVTLPTSLQELVCGSQKYSNGRDSFGPKITNRTKLPNLKRIAYYS